MHLPEVPKLEWSGVLLAIVAIGLLVVIQAPGLQDDNVAAFGLLSVIVTAMVNRLMRD